MCFQRLWSWPIWVHQPPTSSPHFETTIDFPQAITICCKSLLEFSQKALISSPKTSYTQSTSLERSARSILTNRMKLMASDFISQQKLLSMTSGLYAIKKEHGTRKHEGSLMIYFQSNNLLSIEEWMFLLIASFLSMLSKLPLQIDWWGQTPKGRLFIGTNQLYNPKCGQDCLICLHRFSSRLSYRTEEQACQISVYLHQASGWCWWHGKS